MGLAFVLGVKTVEPDEPIAAGGEMSLTALTFGSQELSAPPLRRRPSSKKRLRPSLGLAVAVLEVAVEEMVRLESLGFRTLIPASLRWYESRGLLALTQSKPAEGGAVVGAAVGPSRRQLPHVVGVFPERDAGVCDSGAWSSSWASERMLSSDNEGRDAIDWRLPGRMSLCEPTVPGLAASEVLVSAMRAPGGRYLPEGGLVAVDETDAIDPAMPRPLM